MSEWRTATLSEIAEVKVSNVDKKSIVGEKAVLLCNYMDVYGNDYITRRLEFMEASASIAEVERFKIANGDVIITKDSETPCDIGIPAVVVETIEDLVCGYHLALIKPTLDVVDSVFLSKQLAQSQTICYFSRYASGSTRYGLSNKSIANVSVNLPPLKEQQKIARILQTIDRAIEKTEALINKYQQIKAGLMHDLFTRGIDTDGHLRPPRDETPHLYQQTPIGWIPKEWEPCKLSKILIEAGGYLQTGPFGSQLHSYEYTDEGVPVVMPQDVNNGMIEEFRISRINGRTAKRLLKHWLKEGDIIIARRGELSRASAVSKHEEGWICGTGCFLLRLGGSALDPRFFAMTYRHPMIQRQIAGMSIGSTMPSLNNEIMGKLVFPYLPLDEQVLIADTAGSIDKKIAGFFHEVNKLQKQKSGLMHDLLTGKVRVQLHEPTAEAEIEAAHG